MLREKKIHLFLNVLNKEKTKIHKKLGNEQKTEENPLRLIYYYLFHYKYCCYSFDCTIEPSQPRDITNIPNESASSTGKSHVTIC